MAEKFGRDLISDGAAGLFRPTYEMVRGVPDDILEKWTKDSFQFYDYLARSDDAVEAGATIVTGYHFTNDEIREPLIKDIVYHFRYCTEKDYVMFPEARNYKTGIVFTTPIIEGRWFLPYLAKKFQAKGGRILKRKISSFQELVGEFDIVVNATGYASKFLCNDDKLIPNRGQMLRLKAPWIKHAVFSGDHNSWIIPCRNNVVVGGTRMSGNDSTDVDQSQTKAMLERAYKMEPSLRSAEIEETWVGIRPTRIPLRVEKELMKFNDGKTLKVVHNYGHGSNGLALAWGTAAHATSLVQNFLNSRL